MKMGRREHFLGAVLALVPLAAWLFVFQPRNADIRTVRAETDAMQATLSRLKELDNAVGDVGAAVEAAETQLLRFRENIPDAQDVDDLLRELAAIGVRHNLDVKSVRTLTQVDLEEFSELPISLRIEGQFTAAYGFLADLERLPRITRVREMELRRDLVKSSQLDASQGDINLDLTLVIYFERDKDRTDRIATGGRS